MKKLIVDNVKKASHKAIAEMEIIFVKNGDIYFSKIKDRFNPLSHKKFTAKDITDFLQDAQDVQDAQNVKKVEKTEEYKKLANEFNRWWEEALKDSFYFGTFDEKMKGNFYYAYVAGAKRMGKEPNGDED